MANIYNQIDWCADQLGCSFVLIHHASKGNQSVKSVTDVGSGAGSQSRGRRRRIWSSARMTSQIALCWKQPFVSVATCRTAWFALAVSRLDTRSDARYVRAAWFETFSSQVPSVKRRHGAGLDGRAVRERVRHRPAARPQRNLSPAPKQRVCPNARRLNSCDRPSPRV